MATDIIARGCGIQKSKYYEPSTISSASLNIPINGTTPTTPNLGDIYSNGSDLFYRRHQYLSEAITIPRGYKSVRNAISGSELYEGTLFNQTDEIQGLYRYNDTTGWNYLGGQDWKEYTPIIGIYSGTTPTLATTKVIKGLYRVSGKTLHIKFMLYTGSGSGTVGAGAYTISIPSGMEIDTELANLPIGTYASSANNSIGVDGMILGNVSWASGASNASTSAKVVALSSTALGIYVNSFDGFNGGDTLWGSGFSYLNVAECSISFIAEIPITTV